MMFFLLLLGIIFLLLSPKLFLLAYLAINAFTSNYDDRSIKLFNYLVFFYLSMTLSIMLADRPYYIGEEVGFGDDMLHYYHAFEWVVNSSFKDFFSEFYMITSLTGSSEPVFWFIVKLIGLIIRDPYYIHVFLTFFGCLLIFIAGEVWNKKGLLFLFFYTNTITFFAFQGSAVRSGLAFSVALLGYVLFYKRNNKWFYFLPPFIHYSLIPFPVITYISNINFKNKKNLLRFIFFSIIFAFSFLLLVSNSLDSGLGRKLESRFSEDIMNFSALLQFIIESIFTIVIINTIFKDKVDRKLKLSLIYFFILSLLIVFVSPSIFSRFYRYEYILLILIYASIYELSRPAVRFFILLFSFSWYLFLGYSRFIGVFSEDIFAYINFL